MATTPSNYGRTAQHSWISPEHNETVPVRRVELRQFADDVVRIAKNPLENALAWTIALASLAVGAGLSLIALYGAQQEKGTHTPDWVLVLHWAAVIGFGTSAAFCKWVDGKQREGRDERASILARQIRACDSRAPRTNEKKLDPSSLRYISADKNNIERSYIMSHIQGTGYGSSHDWIGITPQNNSKQTFYECKNCKERFIHFYDIIPNIFEAIKENDIRDICLLSRKTAQ